MATGIGATATGTAATIGREGTVIIAMITTTTTIMEITAEFANLSGR
jgi:hypothetical protein